MVSNRKFFIVLLRWVPLAIMIKYNVLVVDNEIQSSYLILYIFFASSYLASI